MFMPGAWDDIHQEENLISPAFAYGKTLTFYSKSIAPGKTVSKQYYHVEVSKDNGQTWTVVFDLMKDCNVVNQYTPVTIDLSEHMSAEMKIAFHAYDDNNVGLSYWWNIDNLTIYPETEESMINGYAVYRNGIRIGTSTDCTFTDKTPAAGNNIYTVRATGDFGETSDSEAVTIAYTPTGIVSAATPHLQIVCRDGQVSVCADTDLHDVRILWTDGRLAAQSNGNGHTHVMHLSSAPHGVYLLTFRTAEHDRPVVIKFVH